MEGNLSGGKQGRWQMSRAGILNFWFYEDEEFKLEDGRLVLRGTNGAGKSVTMQSFIPLVLDGDKRPHRLDPFGSKDRRIEYYLLGEKDEHSDRTGYLWLEFKHSEKNLYKTIGIGLRARRGVASVGFWGFVIEDGRRINIDFWLHDRVLELEGSGKYPLDRKTLEERIGAGGQVVQEQGTYRDLVNRVLFGFYDREAYKDLLQLLVQLRSPKLSKDVKPTAIYSILVDSLPPLHEEELRPLSEVMEDMDQLADRLDELKLHQVELEKLNRSYEQYNRYIVYHSGSRLLAAKSDSDEVNRQVGELSAQLKAAISEDTNKEALHKSNRERAIEIDTELELLGRSEVMEKQQELEQTEQSLKETVQHAEQTKKRLDDAIRSKAHAELAASKAHDEMKEQLANQADILTYMEELSGDIEFEHHGVYHRYWSPEPPEDTSFSAAWRRDLEEHRTQVGEAMVLAEQERDAERSVADADKELGFMRAQRDEAERAALAAETAASDVLAHWKEGLLEWKESLQELKLSSHTIQQMFEASADLSYEQQSTDHVIRPVKLDADASIQEMVVRKLEYSQERKNVDSARVQLIAELREWQSSREPEPPRSEGRMRTRSGYDAEQGAPLYELCEFHPHLSSEEQASVEHTLLVSGLLDAWIKPDGTIGQLQDRDEDVWITPAPMEWGYTLADVLKPVGGEGTGLSERRIEEVLRSFAWGESFDYAQDLSDTNHFIIGRDYYRFGTITGKVDGTECKAQYVGKEARRRFKLAEIDRLKLEIVDRDDELAVLDEAIRSIEHQIDTIRADVERFPIGDERHQALITAWKAQYDTSAKFQMLMQHEARMADVLREKQEVWSRLKQALIAKTARWTRLKDYQALRDAQQAMGHYLEELSQLLSDWRVYHQATVDAARYDTEAATYAERIELEEDQRDELEDKQYSLRVRLEQLRKLMDELGIRDMYDRIRQLKEGKEELVRAQDRLIHERNELAQQLGGLRARQQQLAEREAESMEKLQHHEQLFRLEMAQKLISELQPDTDGEYLGIADPELSSREQLIRACRKIVSALEAGMSRSNKERLGSIVQDHFNATKHLLGEYVIEAEINEQGRITLISMRDRMRPQRLAALLAEMNNLIFEQQNLLSEKDRELFEEIILRSVGKAIRQRIQRAEMWIKTMNRLMAERDTSSGLKLQLQWIPKAAQTEQELNSDELVNLLRRDAHLLHDDEVEQLIAHFRSRIQWAKQGAAEERETLRKHLYEMLDYRSWFQFSLRYKKGDDAQYREMTDSRFNVLSGGEKAMSMYIPLFAATYSRYADASPDAPKIISLDEAFAGVDDENIRDLFGLLTQMDFDYMMTSQVLWGCYDTVPNLGICEIYRPKDGNYVTLFRYLWNGKTLEPILNDDNLEEQKSDES